MDEVLAYLKENPTYFLATVDEDGNPQIRPFGTINEFEGALYIQTGRSKKCYKQMKGHPRCAISAMGKDGTWLRIECDLVEDDRFEAEKDMMDNYPNLQAMYAAGDGNCTVLRMENAKASISSFTAEPKFFEF